MFHSVEKMAYKTTSKCNLQSEPVQLLQHSSTDYSSLLIGLQNNSSDDLMGKLLYCNSLCTDADIENNRFDFCDNSRRANKLHKKRRFCQVEGCSRVVKSQGLCQRHGAKTKLCNVKGCKKQAQGSYGGMCSKLFCNLVACHLFDEDGRST